MDLSAHWEVLQHPHLGTALHWLGKLFFVEAIFTWIPRDASPWTLPSIHSLLSFPCMPFLPPRHPTQHSPHYTAPKAWGGCLIKPLNGSKGSVFCVLRKLVVTLGRISSGDVNHQPALCCVYLLTYSMKVNNRLQLRYKNWLIGIPFTELVLILWFV